MFDFDEVAATPNMNTARGSRSRFTFEIFAFSNTGGGVIQGACSRQWRYEGNMGICGGEGQRDEALSLHYSVDVLKGQLLEGTTIFDRDDLTRKSGIG